MFAFVPAAALATDLSAAPEPIDYVGLCDSYGERFYYIPGTETCLRVGGKVRIEYRINNFGDAPSAWSDRASDDTNFFARGYLYLDSRTNTEFGLLRTFTSMYLSNLSNTETFTLEHAFIQFGGLTAGKTQSFWDFWTGYAFGVQLTDYSDVKTPVLAYTHAFGNGASATVAIEDAISRQSQLISSGTTGYAGTRLPDLIANIRFDQGWGSAQMMGALHQVRFADASSDGAIGWVIGGGVQVNLPMLGSDDVIALQVAYSDGASGYPLDTWDSRITDAINTGGTTKTTRTWNISGGWSHSFNEFFRSDLEGGYHVADAGLKAYDFSQWGVTGDLVWTPVPGLEIGGELQYRQIDYDSSSGLNNKDEVYVTFRVERQF